jgi:hypothetical protein
VSIIAGTEDMARNFGLSKGGTPKGVHPWGTYRPGGTVTDLENTALVGLVKPGVDQGNTNTCVWQAIAQAVWVSLGRMGLSPVWLSTLCGYLLTRRHTARGGAIRDGGCLPSDAAEVLRETGFVMDTDWPFREDLVDEEPPFDCLIRAPDQDWIRLERIDADGDDLIAAIKSAIASGTVVIRAMAVDRLAMSWSTTEPYTRCLSIEGYHMEAYVGWTRDGFVTPSSWGLPNRVDSWRQVASEDVTEAWRVVIYRDKAAKTFSRGAQ